METIIKNIHNLVPFITENQLEKLEEGALQYRRFARISFKIVALGHTPNKVLTITIEVRQDKSPSENYLKAAELHQRAKDLFKPYLPEDVLFYSNALPYVESPTEKVTPEYLRHFMTEYKIRIKDIVADTGLDKSNVSAWVNGTRDMSQIVKAMFYYYFRFISATSEKRFEIDPDQFGKFEKDLENNIFTIKSKS